MYVGGGGGGEDEGNEDSKCTLFDPSKIVSEYDQEIPQSQTADNPGTARKSRSTIKRHQEDKLSKTN